MTKLQNSAFIGLGGNVGDVLASMASALKFLDSHPHIKLVNVSPVYKTPPWGIVEQDWFYNACAELATSLEPAELLEQCLAAERELKRVRGKRWGPRTIDLDILTFGDQQVSRKNLTIPHPRMHERVFVLKPLNDIAPDLLIKGSTVSDWLAKLDAAKLEQLALEDDWFT